MKKTMKKKMMGGGMAYGKKKKMRDGGILDLNKDGKVTKAEEKRLIDAMTKRRQSKGPMQNLPLPPNFKRDSNVGDPGGKMPKKNKTMKPMRDGGKMLKDVPEGNKGLGKLPKSVRNKMGFKRDGGMMYGKKKMKYGGSVNQNINPYGRAADTSLVE